MRSIVTTEPSAEFLLLVKWELGEPFLYLVSG